MKKISIIFIMFISIVLVGCNIISNNEGNGSNNVGNGNNAGNDSNHPNSDVVDDNRPNYEHTHSLEHVVAKEATCTEEGNIEYWYCSGCDKYFSDEACTTEVTLNEIVFALGHDYVDGVCSRCGARASEGLEYELSWDKTYYYVSGIGTCTDTEIYVSDFYNGLPVTGIGWEAFSDCSQLTSIEIPSSVTSIGESAFHRCGSLTTIKYQGDLTSWLQISGLDDLMRYGSSSKELYINGSLISGELIIPKGVTSIPNYAFAYCSSITSITIPSSVTSIEWNAFYNCSQLTTINYQGDIKGWLQISDLYGLMEHSSSSKELYINGSLISGELIIPEGVTSIPGSAFAGCSQLTSIEIPSSVTSIGINTFSGCSQLTSITIPSTVTSLGDYAFEDCSSLTSITIPSTVTSLGDYAFEDCSSLTSIEIPSNVESIGNHTFFGCSQLTSITIPSSVKSIGDNAFHNCDQLTTIKYQGDITSWLQISGLDDLMHYGSSSIELYINGSLLSGELIIPEGVTSIPSSAFRGCSSLTSIEIPTSVTSIGSSAFYNCSSLTSIEIPSSVKSIGNSAFYNCSSLTTIKYLGDATSWLQISDLEYLMSFGSSSKELYINGVLATDVVIEEGITSIPSYAFYNCSQLTSIDIPSSVTSIGYRAFNGCSSLVDIIIPASVETLGSQVFDNTSLLIFKCEALEQPAGWNSSWNSANVPVIWDCRNNDIATDGYTYAIVNNINYKLKDGVAIVANQSTKLIDDIVLPSSFTYNGITYEVQGISSKAFEECRDITSITIPSTITTIEDYAFNYCVKLIIYCEIESQPDTWSSEWNKSESNNISVVWDCNNNNIDSNNYKIIKDSNGLRYGLKDGVATILTQSSTLSGNIVIPSSVDDSYGISYPVKYISDYAFYNCRKLTSIDIPSSVTSIGNRAFFNCDQLTTIKYQEDLTSWLQISGLTNLMGYGSSSKELYINGSLLSGELIIPEGVTSIPMSAFAYCSSITSITIPSSVTSIGYYAFSGCSQLTSIEIPSSVTSIGYYAFSGCSSLTSIEIPSSVTSIESSTFKGCSQLTTVTFGENSGLTSIGMYAFENCSQLRSIEIPSSVTSIGNEAFYNCSQLTSIIIPSSVTSIEIWAFKDCNQLTTIKYQGELTSWLQIDSLFNLMYYGSSSKELYINGSLLSGELIIPEGVTSISSYAFRGCSQLTSITIPSSVESIGYSAFENCSQLTSIEIPSSVTSIGNYAFFDCYSLTSIKIPSGVTSINDLTFYNCSSLTSVEIPSSVESIEVGAFYGCSSLTSIEIPSSVTSIESSTFKGCSQLTTVTFGENSQLTSIGMYAFENCSQLRSIEIPSSVESIGHSAFENCSQLRSIEIPSSVTSIGYYAFRGCSSLTSIIIPLSVTSIGDGAFYDCYNLTIYCEASSEPSGWRSNWSMPDSHVVWGYTGN